MFVTIFHGATECKNFKDSAKWGFDHAVQTTALPAILSLILWQGSTFKGQIAPTSTSAEEAIAGKGTSALVPAYHHTWKHLGVILGCGAFTAITHTAFLRQYKPFWHVAEIQGALSTCWMIWMFVSSQSKVKTLPLCPLKGEKLDWMGQVIIHTTCTLVSVFGSYLTATSKTVKGKVKK